MPLYRPVHPGELLRLYVSDEVTVSRLAEHLGVTRANLSRVLNGRLGVSPLLAVKLSEAFPRQSAEFWMNLQVNYELALARKEKRKKIKPLQVGTVAAAAA